MGRRKRFIRKFRHAATYPFGRLKVAVKKKLGWLGNPLILTYRGFGNQDFIYFRGRVVEDYNIPAPERQHSIWQNMLSTFKRYKSDGLPDMHVKVTLGDKEKDVITDDEGFFDAYFLRTDTTKTKIWQSISCHLMASDLPKGTLSQKQGEVMLPHPQAELGIISDIDDTLLVSHSTTLLKKIRLMALKNAHTRLPFEGAASFYHALSKGKNGHAQNPFFYVSSSEWNLYDMLEDFCFYHNIPKGIFLLQEMEHSIFKFWKSGGGNHDHKLHKISLILDTYTHLPFILIGDSGQKDPLLYRKICLEYPNRIRAVYIRDIQSAKKRKLVNSFVEELKKQGIDMVLVQNTKEAAEHAAAKGFIQKESLTSIL